MTRSYGSTSCAVGIVPVVEIGLQPAGPDVVVVDQGVVGNNHIVARIVAGDHSAEEELVARFSRGVMFLLRQHARDPDVARDLHQDTFEVVILRARAGEIRKPSQLKSYVASVAKNLALEHYRKDKRRGTKTDNEMIQQVAESNAGPFESLHVEQVNAFIREALDEIPVARDRMLLRRYFIDEIPKEALCSELGLSPTHFDRVKYRALKRLIELVKSRGARVH